jgi:hypothetical protein
MKIQIIVKIFSIIAMLTSQAFASPKIGTRKYSMDQVRPSDTVLIVSEGDDVNGSFMRDPESNAGKTDKLKNSKTAKHAATSKVTTPRVPESEKSFKAMAIVGTLHNPRVGFAREYIDLDQLEEIDQPAFSDELVQQLKKFDN